MKYYKALANVDFSRFTVEKGKVIGLFDDVVDRYLSGGYLEETSLVSQGALYKGQCLNYNECLIIPRGGIGDILATSIAAAALKIKYPYCRISFVDWGHGILREHPYIDAVIPFPTERMNDASFHILYEDRNNDPIFDRISYVDGVLSRAYFFGEVDRRPILTADRGLRFQFAPIFEEIRAESNKPIILVNYGAGGLPRRLPPSLVRDFISKYCNDYKFIFINYSEYVQATNEFIDQTGLSGMVTNLSEYSTDTARYIALFSLVDGVVTCDSSPLHIAAALGKPCVAIFSNIRANARLYYNTTGFNWGYSGRCCQSPCSFRFGQSARCPEAGLYNNVYSPCLIDIPAEYIAHFLEQALDKSAIPPSPKVCPACGANVDFKRERIQSRPRMYSCPDCGLSFAYPAKALDYSTRSHVSIALNKTYDAIHAFPKSIDEYDNFARFKFRAVPKYNLILRILSYLGLNDDVTLLDIGSGNATIPKFIRDRLDWNIFCTETNEAAVAFMNEHLGLTAVCNNDMRNLPSDFPSKFDIVTSFEVMEHVTSPLEFLAGIRELLPDTGFALLSVPNLAKVKFLERSKCLEIGDFPPHHLTWWTEKALQSIATRAGFADSACCFYPMYFARLYSFLSPVSSDVAQLKLVESIFRYTSLLWENVGIADSIFLLASCQRKLDLSRIVRAAFIQTLYQYGSTSGGESV